MSSFTEAQALSVTLPRETFTISVPNGSASTARSLAGFSAGEWLTFYASGGAVRVRAAASSTGAVATAGDFPWPAGVERTVRIDPSTLFVSFYGDAASQVYYAKTSP